MLAVRDLAKRHRGGIDTFRRVSFRTIGGGSSLVRGRAATVVVVAALIAVGAGCGGASSTREAQAGAPAAPPEPEAFALGCGMDEGTTGSEILLDAAGTGSATPGEAINAMLPRVAEGAMERAPERLTTDTNADGWSIRSDAEGEISIQYRSGVRVEAIFSIVSMDKDTWQVDGYEICNRSYRADPKFDEAPGEALPTDPRRSCARRACPGDRTTG